MGEEPNNQIIQPRESPALHRSLNALWARFSVPFCPDHRVGGVLSFFSIRRNWTPPTPHPLASVPPPPFGSGGRGAHSLEREGMGESQFRRRDIHCGTLSPFYRTNSVKWETDVGGARIPVGHALCPIFSLLCHSCISNTRHNQLLIHALQIILDLCIPEKEIAKTCSQI